MRWVSWLTTGVVIVIIMVSASLVIRAKMPTPRISGSFRTYAKFRDGSRLAVGSPVVIAGVRVGTIEKLSVEGQLARIDMRLQDDLDLPVDSFATRRADSLFGDSYIEIIPALGDGGATPGRRMKSGDPITHVVEGGSTDAILRGMASAFSQIDNALEIVHGAVIQSRTWVGGPMADQLGNGADWLSQGHIEGPMASADRALATIDDLTTRGAGALARTTPDVTHAIDRIDRTIAGARNRLHETKVDLVSALHETREGFDRIDPQIAQAAEIVTAINDGHGDDWRGTLGRLVNDPSLGDTLEDVASEAHEAVASFNRFKSWLGMRVEYDWFSRAVRFYATAEVRARDDKFYLVELERGPLGGVPNDELSEVAGTASYVRHQEIHDRLRFTAQFGKQLGRLSVRGGLKDGTFGFGADTLLLEGRLKLSADLYGSFQATPRLKLVGALAVFRSIYVLAGVDDALNAPGYLPIVSGNPTAPRTFDHVRYGRDYFVGTMLLFNDADISVLLRVYGALLVGLL
ncbi:MAG TPA: MlaD family protein [Kofleriaceae bacterium]|nr:MlaD family protein [Kofleriaceae bacterium]